MANIIIKPQDQSAPKEHWAEGEIRKAQADIDAGNFIPDPDPVADERMEAMEGLGLRLGEGALTGKLGPHIEKFRQTHEELMAAEPLMRHPRVVEAMERMAKEIEENPNSHEVAEKTCMMREMAEQQAKRGRWAEQGKLAGEDDEKSRYGEILSPQQFYDRLGKVTGKGKIKLSPHVVYPAHQVGKTGRVGLYIPNPEWKGDALVYDDSKHRQAMLLKARGEHELAKAKRLRKLMLHSEADKTFDSAGEFAKQATILLMEESAEMQLRPPELLRVATLQWPLGTEWMVCNFDEFGVVTSAKFLGWRTALLTMIRSNVITEQQAHRAFPVGSGPAADWYLEQLLIWRSAVGRVQ
jgi:hypothetical protein